MPACSYMSRWSRRFAASLAAAFLVSGCAWFRPPKVSILEYGVFRTSPEPERQDAPDTARGSVGVVSALADPTLLELTNQIPAALGTVFGIRTSARGGRRGRSAAVRIRVVHPPMVNPADGSTREVDEWDATVQVGYPRYNGWRFEEQHELVPGTWRIQVLMGGNVVAEQAFEVSLK